MNSKLIKILSGISAIGAVIVSLVMIWFEVVDGHVPAPVWLAFSVCMFAYVALDRMNKKQASSDEAE